MFGSLGKQGPLECFIKKYDLANQAFALGNEYSNSKLVRKLLRSFPVRFNIKVTTIEGAKYIETMRIDELIGSLLNFEINLKEANKGKLKFEKNIAFLMAETMSAEQGTVIKEMQEQLALVT
ncbi:hypothetical protein J1N35_035101 [Gossypium stocksii]|uniref:Gag-pol polyprotein n=1 Tax=Gossypium stocksii TaxID=47602 RepID=A0A9D3ZPU7_9ROSI|nr:hypothetical protein J1N35_035101 [Gossypium stocksii]